MEKSAKGRDSNLEPLPKMERRLAELEAHILHGGDGVGHACIDIDVGIPVGISGGLHCARRVPQRQAQGTQNVAVIVPKILVAGGQYVAVGDVLADGVV